MLFVIPVKCQEGSAVASTYEPQLKGWLLPAARVVLLTKTIYSQADTHVLEKSTVSSKRPEQTFQCNLTLIQFKAVTLSQFSSVNTCRQGVIASVHSTAADQSPATGETA